MGLSHVLPQPGLLPSAFAFGFGEIASKRSEDGGERIKGEGERKNKFSSATFANAFPSAPALKKRPLPPLRERPPGVFFNLNQAVSPEKLTGRAAKSVGRCGKLTDRFAKLSCRSGKLTGRTPKASGAKRWSTGRCSQ